VDFACIGGYIDAMNISLPKEQQEWLEAEVAAGHFSSVDEALAIAVAELKALQEDDLAWAKPYVDEARAEIARGETIPGDEFLKWLRERSEELRRRGS
jgi:antitoxin ParD1/3/4